MLAGTAAVGIWVAVILSALYGGSLMELRDGCLHWLSSTPSGTPVAWAQGLSLWRSCSFPLEPECQQWPTVPVQNEKPFSSAPHPSPRSYPTAVPRLITSEVKFFFLNTICTMVVQTTQATHAYAYTHREQHHDIFY